MRVNYNDRMLVLRYLYVLALVIWLGGMIVLGGLAAPALFGVLEARMGPEGRAAAGAVFGEILSRFHLLSYVSGAVLLAALGAMALLGPRPRQLGARMGIVAIMLAIALYSGIALTGRLERLQERASGPVTALAPDDPVRQGFSRLHGWSTTLMMINVLGGLVLLYWEARD
jgi:hypothetical protein